MPEGNLEIPVSVEPSDRCLVGLARSCEYDFLLCSNTFSVGTTPSHRPSFPIGICLLCCDYKHVGMGVVLVEVFSTSLFVCV